MTPQNQTIWQEFAPVPDDLPVVEPGIERGDQQRDPDDVGNDDRGGPAQVGREDMPRDSGQAEQHQQLRQQPVAARAAVGFAEFAQLAALDRRQRGQLGGHLAPDPRLCHGRMGRVDEHTMQLFLPLPMPLHESAQHPASRSLIKCNDDSLEQSGRGGQHVGMNHESRGMNDDPGHRHRTAFS